VDTDELGIDRGPIVLMIENYCAQRVWRRFMQNDIVQRGLQRVGFVPLLFAAAGLRLDPAQNAISLTWASPAGGAYQVEYSADLSSWFNSPTGDLRLQGPTATWTDSGPPATRAHPFTIGQRFYRVLRFGTP
jgi:hypothetical protein